MSPAPDPGRILDAGAAGLAFFAEYLPYAHRWGAATSTTVDSLRERYAEQCDLDPATLVADAAELTRLASILADPLGEQDGQLRSLTEAWEGDAADTARAGLETLVARGRALQSGVHELSRALDAAAVNIAAAVAEKARIVKLLEGSLIDGRTSDEVGVIVAGAATEPGGPTPGQISRWFPSAGSDDPVSTAEQCARWLSERFAPEIDAAIDTVLRACDDTDRVVMREFDSLAKLFDRIESSGNAGLPSAVSGLPSGGAPLGFAPHGSSRGAGSDPVQAGADLITAAAGFTGAVLELATSGVRAATTLLDAAVDSLPGPTAPDADPLGAAPEVPAVTPRTEGETPTGAGEQHSVNAPSSVDPAAPAEIAVALPSPEADSDAGIRDPGDASPPRPEPTREETDAAGTKENGVTPAAVPPVSSQREGTKSPGVPAAAGSDRADRTGGAEQPGRAEQPETVDGGAVLAEAGPL